MGFDTDTGEWTEPESGWASTQADYPLLLAELRPSLGTDDISVNGVHPEAWAPKEVRANVAQVDLEAAVAAHDPVTLTPDVATIPADGATEAVVTYRRRPDKAPAQVEFMVNGQAVQVATTDGIAEVAVTAANPGPIEVTAAERTVVITAEEVP